MRHLFIVNPVAGGKKNRSREVADEIKAAMETRAEPYEIYTTTAPLDAAMKVRRASEDGEPLRVYACGGDGTLNECVNGAAGRGHVAVTHYPCGTGNDFIKMFGKEGVLFRDLPALLNGVLRPIDLIEVQTERERRFGLNICSVGIDARIGTDVHKYSALPLIGGATGYVVSMFVNLVRGVNQHLRITSGETSIDGNVALVCACNGRFYGGGFNPVPEALPDDGILETLIVSDVSRLKFIRVVGKYAKGRYREISEIISHLRGNHIEIESEKELAVNIDGELILAKDVSFTLIPNGVNIVFPFGMRFFESCRIPEGAATSN